MAVMNNIEYEKAIKEAVAKCANENGWANLAELGAEIRQNGIKYKKLLKFLNEYKHIIDIRVDDAMQPPVVYAKLITESAANKAS